MFVLSQCDFCSPARRFCTTWVAGCKGPILRSWRFVPFVFCCLAWREASSETQGQIGGARESLNGRENMAQRKAKYGLKSPWGQYLTRPVSNNRRPSAFWLGRKTQKFSGTNQNPERRRPFGTGLVKHCPHGLYSPFFTFLRAIFFRPLKLSLAPTICPWVSEDGREAKWSVKRKSKALEQGKLPSRARFGDFASYS